ncbi:MAG: carboxypeptidase regulatory-like domain-containing protein [Candidatus Acidiferrales bacterium]
MTPFRKLPLFIIAAFIFPAAALAQTTGTIRGAVNDPSGLVVAGARVTVTWQETHATRTAASDANGDFEFPALAVGHYTAEIEAVGFKKYVQKDIDVTLGHVVVINAKLQIGASSQEVTVTAGAPLVETTSTQLGAVVNERAVTQLPLNARDTYQLLQLQPGVQSQVGSDLFYGSDQSGVVSVNGGRGRSNNYSVNGGDANDQFVNLPAIQPSPDSIEEFRVLTNTFDAEFGRNSGSVVNVVTKSGTNQFHGDIFEFFRNKVLNARGFFDIVKPDFKQNQFGGTFGGPIRRDNTFFFFSYEGRRIRRGGAPSTIPIVPTAAERMGNFTEAGAASPFAGSVATGTFANVLNSRPGCAAGVAVHGGSPIVAGTPYATFTNGTGTHPGIFTDMVTGQENIIPTACFDPTAVDLLNQFVPLPNFGASQFLSVPVGRTRVDQFSARFDKKITNSQQLSGYYYFDDDTIFQAFSFFQAAGSNVPGFGGNYKDRFQQWNLSHTWTISATSVNEARFAYFREGQGTFDHPQRNNLVVNSCATVPASMCFASPGNPRIGITPGLGPAREGVPFISIFGGFNIGNNFEGELPQTGDSFNGADSFSKVMGKHSMKFGVDARRQRFDQTIFFDVNGEYFYTGGLPNDVVTSNGSFFPDYLLGLPDSYTQSAPEPENLRSTSVYLFAQDSWKIRPSLTLNYGLRWELNTPYTDLHQKLQAFRPGQATSIFSCQLGPNNPLVATFGTTNCGPGSAGQSVFPFGMVFPGDKSVPSGVTRAYYRAFAPRLGLAWSPGWSGGLLGALTGGPGKTSVRIGWGIFYNPIEQLVLEQGGGPPYAGIVTISAPLFNTPFADQFGAIHPNSYAGIRNPARGSSQDFSIFRPILLFGELQPNLRSQYSEQYNLTIQRELAKDVVLQVGYVGSQAHRLLASHDLNPGNAQTCLDIISLLGPATCFPFGADGSYTIPAGTIIPPGFTFHLPYGSVPTISGGSSGVTLANPIVLPGIRPFSSPKCQPTTGVGCPPDGLEVFSSLFAQDTIANSSYNSLQVSAEKRFSQGLQFLAAYTWSKSIDEASSFENILNPLDFKRSRALSLFNASQRFVLSYYWELPIPKQKGFAEKALNGWALSGITTFQSGFPIRITSASDLELENSFDFELPGEPNLSGALTTQNPRKSGCAAGTGPGFTGTTCKLVPNQYFNPNSFSNQALGTIGNAPRSLCCAPGINNFDLAALKDTPLTEGTKLEFRAEFFNIWNHAQFFPPDGNITDGFTFGEVTKARDPRLIQFGLKLLF